MVEEVLEEEASEPEAKRPYTEVVYGPGSYPFVCGTCKNFSGEDQTCRIVEGPYAGKVAPDDVCLLWAVNLERVKVR